MDKEEKLEKCYEIGKFIYEQIENEEPAMAVGVLVHIVAHYSVYQKDPFRALEEFNKVLKEAVEEMLNGMKSE